VARPERRRSGDRDDHTLFRETTQAWVDRKDDQQLAWLKDGTFLW